MKPPYDISSRILKRISSISEKIGEVNATYLSKQSPQLRKQNRINRPLYFHQLDKLFMCFNDLNQNNFRSLKAVEEVV